MRYFILIGLLVCSTFAFSQVDSSNYYIKQLDWNSFEITTNYVSMLVLKEDAKRIVSISSKHKVDELINCLTNKKKSVVSHIILTKIFEPDTAKFIQVYNYAKDSTIASVQYTYNGLTWNWNKILGNKINKKDMEAIKKYWLNKLVKLKERSK